MVSDGNHTLDARYNRQSLGVNIQNEGRRVQGNTDGGREAGGGGSEGRDAKEDIVIGAGESRPRDAVADEEEGNC
jgi:hypothetical protein